MKKALLKRVLVYEETVEEYRKISPDTNNCDRTSKVNSERPGMNQKVLTTWNQWRSNMIFS